MSRIFDALQKSESERSGLPSSNVSTTAHELLQGAERIEPTALPPSSPCPECASPVPDDILFCPKCDSFQGATAAGDRDDRDFLI